jgi:threonine/homoserine/homoserine lactone efflux protein
MGLAAVAALCASGLLSILTALPGLAQSLTICACAYLARLAWVIAAAPIGGGAKAEAVAPTFTAGLLLGLSNPKAYLAFVTLFASQTIAAGSTRADATLKWGLIILVIFAVDVAWLYAGARLGRVPVSPRAERSINVVLGVGILAVSVHSLPGFAG